MAGLRPLEVLFDVFRDGPADLDPSVAVIRSLGEGMADSDTHKLVTVAFGEGITGAFGEGITGAFKVNGVAEVKVQLATSGMT